MYDIADDLQDTEYQLYGQYAQTYVKIDNCKITSLSELKTAYDDLIVDDNVYECMRQQFVEGKIISPIYLNSFYNHTYVEFNAVFIDMKKFPTYNFYVAVTGSAYVTTIIQNSTIIGKDTVLTGNLYHQTLDMVT